MANFLDTSVIAAVYALRRTGLSQRRVAKALGINRETVARYLQSGEAAPNPATSPPCLPLQIRGTPMITDAQVFKLRRLLLDGHPLCCAALKAGMDAKSARKYRDSDRLREMVTPGTWRTRKDPFRDVWPQLRDMLKLNPELTAKALFTDLQRRFPGRFSDFQLRTLQRKIKALKVVGRPMNESVVGQYSDNGKPDVLGYPDHQWMLRVLQTKEPIGELGEAVADAETSDRLAKSLRDGSLSDRNKALTIVASIHGIPIRSICAFLNISRATVKTYRNTYRLFGVERLFEGFYDRPHKSDDCRLRDAVFSTLHTPPSAFGINRTTWKMGDLRRVLCENGQKASAQVIRTIFRAAGYQWKNARKVLTSNDPNYREKLAKIQAILSNLGPNDRFFSIDEYGPFAVKMQGGRSLMPPGTVRTVPQRQKSKGRLILTAALELSTNQVTHFYSEKKNTVEMIKLLEVLLVEYANCDKIYFSWDAASWHASKKLNERVDEINSARYRAEHRCPSVELVPLPSCAQFLNVIESVFSGMAKAIIHNSDYESLEACKAAIDRHFSDRNDFFKMNPKKAGKMIWGQERVPSQFSPANDCKNPKHHFVGF
jgi:transposase